MISGNHQCEGSQVALLAEGVDRNYFFFVPNRLLWEVALLAEGVDRNYFMNKTTRCMPVSPSSRRAWIEM